MTRFSSSGMVQITKIVWRAAPLYLLGHVLLTLVAGTAPVAITWLTKLVIDDLVGVGDATDRLIWLAAGLAIATMAAAVVPHGTEYLQRELSRRVGLTVQDSLFAALDRQVGLGRLENPRFHDRLLLAQDAGRSSPQEALSNGLGMVQSATTMAGFLGSLLMISPVMAGVVVLAGIPTLIAELALSRRRARLTLGLSHAERREMFYAHLLTDVEAGKEIRLFGIGAFLRGRMLGELRHIHRGHRGLDRRELLTQSGLALLSTGVAGAGLAWAVIAAANGRLSVGDVALFVGAVTGVQGSVSGISSQAAWVHHALLLFRHWLEIVRLDADLPVRQPPRRVPQLKRGIEFRGVWFRYSDDHPWVLRGVDFEIPHGRSLALVGRNGEGKSTLVKLLCRFYDPSRGAILWDGIDLREFDPGDLRERFGAVFQDYMAYDLTAAENIAVADLTAIDDRERIHDAARFAGVHDVLAALPAGYDSVLTRIFDAGGECAEAGVLLSGGQWQRVALARAMLRGNRDLLILDEPSSGLDAEAEYEIHSRLRTHRQGRTSLLISHRLGAVRDADVIVVLNAGRVAEFGDHESLLSDGGTYARLFSLQASGYQLSGDPVDGVRTAGG